MDFIRRNIFKLIYYTIITSIIVLPIFFYYSYNVISHETYQKKYYFVKENSPDFVRKAVVQDEPIININSLKSFGKNSVLKIFNYETAFAENKLELNKSLFSNASYEGFKSIYLYRVSDEISNDVVIKEAYINEGPYYFGSFKYYNKKAWKIYMEMTETFLGLSGEQRQQKKKIYMIIIEDDFRKNGKGLSIDSLEIR